MIKRKDGKSFTWWQKLLITLVPVVFLFSGCNMLQTAAKRICGIVDRPTEIQTDPEKPDFGKTVPIEPEKKPEKSGSIDTSKLIAPQPIRIPLSDGRDIGDDRRK